MQELQNGSLVKHVSLGVGKVVALEPLAVHVFFPDGDKRFAAKLRLPGARALLRTEGFEPNQWLAGLTAFSLDEASGRYALAATFMTHEQAVAQLRIAYPEGFAPAAVAAGQGTRPARWRAAGEAWAKHLGNGAGEKLVEEGEVELLVKRALQVDKLIAPLLPSDEGVVATALADVDLARPYFAALTELLSVPSPGRARFEKLFSAARGLPIEPPQQWLMATLFPFVADPTRHVLMRPRATNLAAERIGCDIRHQPSPVWPTYSALRSFEVQLLERLAPEGAVDFADVEAFLHVIAARPRTAAGAAPRAAKKSAAVATSATAAAAKKAAAGRSRS
jgi:hypothetical protein